MSRLSLLTPLHLIFSLSFLQARSILPEDTRPIVRVAARDLSAYVRPLVPAPRGAAAPPSGWGVQSGSPETDAAAAAVVPQPSSRVPLD